MLYQEKIKRVLIDPVLNLFFFLARRTIKVKNLSENFYTY
jgi:hypothetical protein